MLNFFHYCFLQIYLWILKPKTTKDSEVDVGYLTGSEEIKKRSKGKKKV